jgi:hypothetical protein
MAEPLYFTPTSGRGAAPDSPSGTTRFGFPWATKPAKSENDSPCESAWLLRSAESLQRRLVSLVEPAAGVLPVKCLRFLPGRLRGAVLCRSVGAGTPARRSTGPPNLGGQYHQSWNSCQEGSAWKTQNVWSKRKQLSICSGGVPNSAQCRVSRFCCSRGWRSIDTGGSIYLGCGASSLVG